MASDKQITFIENLLRDREIGTLADDLVAQTVRADLGENLSTARASRFIELLLTCPEKVRLTAAEIAADREEERRRRAMKKAPHTDLKVGSRVALNGHDEVIGTVISITNSKKGCRITLDAPALVQLDRGYVGAYDYDAKTWVPTADVIAGIPSDWHLI